MRQPTPAVPWLPPVQRSLVPLLLELLVPLELLVLLEPLPECLLELPQRPR